MKKYKYFLILTFVVSASLMFLRDGQAFSVRYLSLENLTKYSQDVMQVSIQKVENGVVDENGMKVTYVTAFVHDIIKGTPNVNNDGTIVFKQIELYGAPGYKVGSRIVLFLHGESEEYGLTSPVGASQGIVHLVSEPDGSLSLKSKSDAVKKLKVALKSNSKFPALARSLSGSDQSKVSYINFKSVVSSY